MAKIRIERVPVKKFFLGYLGFDHLQLAFEPDSTTGVAVPQDEWYVMEGLRVPTADGVKLGVLGDNGRTLMRIANGGVTGDALVAEIGTPETRGSNVLTTQNAQDTWNRMALHAANVNDQIFNYNAYGMASSLTPTLNSSSFIASVIYAGGFDVESSLPHNLRFSPGVETLLGSLGDDQLRIQKQFTALFGGMGIDLLQGMDDPSRIDRMYGGGDDDLFSWSQGKNYLHGGDSSWSYKDDGIDTVNYSGAGTVHIDLNPAWVEHLVPQYFATFDSGSDYLLSIERLVWNSDSTDSISVGPGLQLIENSISIILGSEGGEGEAADPKGDTLDLSEVSSGVIVTQTTPTAHFVTAPGQVGDGGIWVDSAEWLIASSSDDRIYGGSSLKGIEGGDGNDLIDTHLITAGQATSPKGYDIEILGEEGNDTIVTSAGRTLIDAGAGADRIVVSKLSSSDGTVEIVIDNADSNDTLFAAYNLFNESGEGYEGSDLMALVGAMGTYDELVNEGWELIYENRLEDDKWNNVDEIDGVVRFAGSISYRMDGGDLLITMWEGEGVTETIEIDDAGHTQTRNTLYLIDGTETVIRVLDFSEGDLGLQFFDPGTADIVTIGGEDFYSYPNWDSAVQAMNPDMLDPFEEAPSAPTSDPNDPGNATPAPARENGTDDADLIALSGPSHVSAGGGDDQITSQGRNDDTIDGGTGADQMAGAEGNDRYFVDDAGDVVIELAGAGQDTIISEIDFTLSDNVEHLTLADGATSGIGNDIDNRIIGNAADNSLFGMDGNDMLYGGLGDDLLAGGNGSDFYTYVQGDGFDSISDDGAGAEDVDTLYLSGGINPADVNAVRLQSNPTDLVLLLDGGGRITLTNQGATTGAGIDEIRFDNVAVWSSADIAALAAAAPIVSDAQPEAVNDSFVYGGTDDILLSEPLLANDSDPSTGGPLTLVGVSDVSAGAIALDSNGNIALSLPPGYEGKVTFRYTIANADGATASATAEVTVVANAAPIATSGLPDQSAIIGEAWSLALPAGFFTDADNDSLSYFATLSDGSDLPSWLTFDETTLTLSGTPPADLVTPLVIRIDAYDGFVTGAVEFTLTATPATGTDPDQTIASTSADEQLIGGSGNDTFTILGNNQGFDTFAGGAGTDTILGSQWNDTIGLANVAGNLSGIEAIDGGAGNDIIKLTTGNDALDLSGIAVTGIELIDAQAGNDTVTGSIGSDVIRGNAGDDLMDGGNGNDTFTILGNAEGFDVFLGGAGTDTILGSQWNDTIGLANIAGNLTGIEAIDGGAGNDIVKLTAGSDTLDLSAIAVTGIELIDAQAGNDTVTGSAGNDVIRGNAGDDLLDGGNGNDTFTILGNPEGFDDFLGGAGTDTILGSQWNDTIGLANIAGNLSGIEVIDGGAGHDIIRLTSGNDTLDLSGIAVTSIEQIEGREGNDTIISGTANDFILGGSGADTFVFMPGSGHDVILDFQIGTHGARIDRIDVSNLGFSSASEVLAAAQDIDGDTVITLASDQTLTLHGVASSTLAIDHFLIA